VVHLVEALLEGLPNEVPLRHEGIWGVIADVVARNQIDLLVLGTHGRTGLGKIVAGSVSEQVLRNVYCPVLTVGPEVLQDREKLNFQSVLLATDLEPCSAAPLYAGWLCNEFGGSLTVLHVVSEGKAANDRPEASQVKDMMAANHFSKPSRILIRQGPPADTILETISVLRPDVAVLGARHLERGTSGHLPWSTVSNVIARAKCPVLTVRELM
jgi:nucleotide-binding universal stress UspA family protein